MRNTKTTTENNQKQNVTHWVGRQSAILSIVEMGLGGLLHGLKIPFTGYFLSLNQAFILSRTSLKLGEVDLPSARLAPASVSNITAILKSLSPAGKKLTPMLAISAQGWLFTVGTYFFGPRFLGVMTGSVLLSLWGFLQPILIYYLLFGETILYVGEYFYEKLNRFLDFDQQQLLITLAVVISVKVLFAVLVSFAACFISDEKVNHYQDKLIDLGKKRKSNKALNQDKKTLEKTSKVKLAFNDLMNPLFLFSLLLTFLFFVFVQASVTQTIWALLRPIAIGFVLFYLIRWVSFDKMICYLSKTRFERFSRSFQTAIQTLKEF